MRPEDDLRLRSKITIPTMNEQLISPPVLMGFPWRVFVSPVSGWRSRHLSSTRPFLRRGGCQVRYQLRLPQLFGGLHPPHRPHGPQHQQRHRLHILHTGQCPPSPRAGPGSGGGPTGHQSQTAAARWQRRWRRYLEVDSVAIAALKSLKITHMWIYYTCYISSCARALSDGCLCSRWPTSLPWRLWLEQS